MSKILQIASSQLGIEETAGNAANPTILGYANETGFTGYTSDETAWCSLFANWVAHKSGLERSKSLAARSWLNVGIPVESPEPGDVVIFWRESRDSWKGHVGFFLGVSIDGNRIYCLGGNQGNQVSVTAKGIDKLLGFRRLRAVEAASFSTKNIKLGDTGTEVVALQNALKQLGYNCGTSDGIFGPKTEQALKDFQASHGDITINGIFNKATREFMEATLNAA